MSTFFPDETDSLDLPELRQLSESEIDEMRSEFSVFVDENGREFLEFDCMLFPLDKISQRGFTGDRWTDGNVYYSFDSNVSELNRSRWEDAAKEWSDVAELRFIQRSNEKNYIHVRSGSVNQSAVGMVGDRQYLTMYNWSMKFVIVHEIGHALGLSHEQSRSDRDKYVSIIWDNIIESKKGNFRKKNSINYSEYDYCSVMHYGQYAFSKNNLTTIEDVNNDSSNESCMGNRHYMTARDAAGMAARYGAPNRARFV